MRFLESKRIADKSRGFDEPSGLSLSADPDRLLSVSDDTSALFLLSQDGASLVAMDIEISAKDLEGIALDRDSNRILAVSEGAASILVVDRDTGAARLVPLAGVQGHASVQHIFQSSDPNDGLEGIAIDSARERIFLLKEKRPRLLLEISMDLSEILRATELTPALGFVDDDQSDRHLDVSGLTVDAATGCLWIVSDRAKRLFLFDPEGRSPTRSFALGWLDGDKPRDIPHAEGIAHDPASDRLYIVNDAGKASRLFTFEILRDGAPN